MLRDRGKQNKQCFSRKARGQTRYARQSPDETMARWGGVSRRVSPKGSVHTTLVCKTVESVLAVGSAWQLAAEAEQKSIIITLLGITMCLIKKSLCDRVATNHTTVNSQSNGIEH